MEGNNITYFAETDARNKRVKFGIKDIDRLRHIYSIGKTGMGKSTMLENMAVQDIQNGNGMAFLDPHGKTADLLLDYIPEERMKDVIYFAPFDTEYPISFNVMEDVGPMRRHLVLSGLMSAFEKVFGEESFSDRMQYILQNTILALLEYPGATLLGINKMLSDKAYRNKVVANVTDPSVKDYWTKEFAGYTDRFAAEAIPAIQNKVGQFTSNPLIRNIIGQSKSSFDIRKIMDEKKILIVNLSKGLVGESNANLLGSMLVTKIYLSAMSRADVAETELKKLPNFYLYVDEFQSFANKSFADILSEARKYKLSLNITHQYIEQMAEEVRAAVFGNVGTLISFRVGSYDAEILEKEFAPVFTAEDIVNLGFVQIYLKLMIDGVASSPFSATTLAPIPKPEISIKDKVVEISRAHYANPKAEVEKKIQEWHSADNSEQKSGNGNGNGNGTKQSVSNGYKNDNGSSGERRAETPRRDEERRDRNRLETRKENSEPRREKERERVVEKGRVEEKNENQKGNNLLKEAITKALQEKNGNTNVQVSVSVSQNRNNEVAKKEEKIPLGLLKNGEKNKNKEAKPENINALREALSKIQNSKSEIRNKSEILNSEIKNKLENEKEAESLEVKGDSKEKKEETSKLQPASSKLSKEIPEEELRKILKGE